MALCQRCICRCCRRNVGVFFLRGLGVALRRHERTCEATRHFLNQEAADRAEEKGDAPSQVEPNVAPSRVDVVKQPDRPDDRDTCGPPSQPSRPAHKVYLYMYDLFGGRSIGRIFLGKKFQAVWHTSIVVEWPNNCCELWYDNQIFVSPPGQTPFRTPDQKRLLGTTPMPHVTMIAYLESVDHEWTGHYDLARRNCVHFSDWVARRLHLAALPDDLVGQAAQVMQTPVARLVFGTLNMVERLRGDVARL